MPLQLRRHVSEFFIYKQPSCLFLFFRMHGAMPPSLCPPHLHLHIHFIIFDASPCVVTVYIHTHTHIYAHIHVVCILSHTYIVPLTFACLPTYLLSVYNPTSYVNIHTTHKQAHEQINVWTNKSTKAQPMMSLKCLLLLFLLLLLLLLLLFPFLLPQIVAFFNWMQRRHFGKRILLRIT